VTKVSEMVRVITPYIQINSITFLRSMRYRFVLLPFARAPKIAKLLYTRTSFNAGNPRNGVRALRRRDRDRRTLRFCLWPKA